MRKKYCLILLLFFISVSAFAQLEVKLGSFKLIEGFENDNPDIQTDENDVLYSVIKIGTVNINDKQHHQLLFEGNAPSFVEVEYKMG